MIDRDFLAIDDLMQVKIALDDAIIVMHACIGVVDLTIKSRAVPNSTLVVFTLTDMVNVELNTVI